MFRIKPRISSTPVRSIDREIELARARYEKYLADSCDNFCAMRSNVQIKDPHTMAGNAYFVLREHINPLNELAKNSDKYIKIEDARALIRDDEFASPVIENELAKKVLITAKDKVTGSEKTALVDRFKENNFIKKVFETVEQLVK